MIEQAKFTYSLLGKNLGKQRKKRLDAITNKNERPL